MKKNKAIAIFCLLFMILIVFAICSSVYLSKRENNKDIIILAANKNYGLTKEQVEQELNKMKSTPTYDELVSLAKKKYGMSEDVFQVVFGWAIGEGYDSHDHYLGYLCDNVGINHYMGYGKTTASSLAASIAGRDSSGYYSTSRMQGRSISAKNNPGSYVAAYKGMYLALKYPEENAHDCDGVSNYSGYGGQKIYSAVVGRYTINVWSVWYDGIKHWNSDGKYSDSKGGIKGAKKEEVLVTLKDKDPRIDYADLCKSKGFRMGSKIAGIVILVVKWLTPMILIILGMTDFTKAMVSNEQDSLGKATKTFIIRMMIAIMLPFIPGLMYYLVDYFIGDLKDEAGELVSCTECLKDPFSCVVELYDNNN